MSVVKSRPQPALSWPLRTVLSKGRIAPAQIAVKMVAQNAATELMPFGHKWTGLGQPQLRLQQQCCYNATVRSVPVTAVCIACLLLNLVLTLSRARNAITSATHVKCTQLVHQTRTNPTSAPK